MWSFKLNSKNKFYLKCFHTIRSSATSYNMIIPLLIYTASVIFSSIVCDEVTGPVDIESPLNTTIDKIVRVNQSQSFPSILRTSTTGPYRFFGEEFLSKHTVMAIFSPLVRDPGPCKYLSGTRKQNHQCRKDSGLVEAVREAHSLAISHCEEQFRYDRWNCTIESRGKRNIFRKLYRETAFVHALTAAAMTHSVARACSQGLMTKCSCGKTRYGSDTPQKKWRWGGCNDNVKHGKRLTRAFLDLRSNNYNGDELSELLRHDSEVGIYAVSSLMKEKCKCHGVSGSCSMKTCWRKMSDFNNTASLLREKYHQAVRIPPSTATIAKPAARRTDPIPVLPERLIRKRSSSYTTLYYLETSPSFCSITQGRRCLNPENCGMLCCGRGYVTRVFREIQKCRCRFENGRCCKVICDYCQRLDDRYFCK